MLAPFFFPMQPTILFTLDDVVWHPIKGTFRSTWLIKKKKKEEGVRPPFLPFNLIGFYKYQKFKLRNIRFFGGGQSIELGLKVTRGFIKSLECEISRVKGKASYVAAGEYGEARETRWREGGACESFWPLQATGDSRWWVLRQIRRWYCGYLCSLSVRARTRWSRLYHVSPLPFCVRRKKVF